jgi:ABC-type uncharacterized transport system YnjBCD ATPase subunit
VTDEKTLLAMSGEAAAIAIPKILLAARPKLLKLQHEPAEDVVLRDVSRQLQLVEINSCSQQKGII